MFERVRSFFSSLNAGSAAEDGLREDDPRVAVAALMFRVMEADGVKDAAEGERIRELLAQAYGLDSSAVDSIALAGEQADHEVIDLYSFTSVIKRGVDYAGRVELVRVLWELVYADGERHELEDNLVWRIAELLDVEARDRIHARRDVAEALTTD